MAKISAQPVYGTPDKTKFKKDLLVIVKNSGTYGVPVYASGSTRKITVEEFQNNLDTITQVKVTLTAVQIKTGSNIILVAGPGAGYSLDPVSCSARLRYGTVAFDCAIGELSIIFGGKTNAIFTSQPGFINLTSNRQIKLLPQTVIDPAAAPCEMGENLEFVAGFSDASTVGDSEIDLYIAYRTIEL